MSAASSQDYQQLNGEASDDEDDKSNDATATAIANQSQCDQATAAPHKVVAHHHVKSSSPPPNDINPSVINLVSSASSSVSSVMGTESQLLKKQLVSTTTPSTGDNPIARNQHTLSLNVKPVRGMDEVDKGLPTDPEDDRRRPDPEGQTGSSSSSNACSPAGSEPAPASVADQMTKSQTAQLEAELKNAKNQLLGLHQERPGQVSHQRRLLGNTAAQKTNSLGPIGFQSGLKLSHVVILEWDAE